MIIKQQNQPLRFHSRLRRTIMPLLATPLLLCPLTAEAQTGDFDIVPRDESDIGARYEDDAWYDVTEWFDGNDYNPTDEAIGRWDDEVFTFRDNASSTDSDNDRNVIDFQTFYGEEPNDEAIRYRDEDNDGTYERMEKYVDTNGDYLADSYVTYDDEDGDGIYDKYDYSQLGGEYENRTHPSNVAQTVAQGLSGKRYQVSGEVSETNMVNRLGSLTLLLKVKSDDNHLIWVDMGPDSAQQIFKGDSVTVQGPLTKRGNKNVLLATALIYEGKSYPVTRPGRKYSGTVESTKTATVQGKKHKVVKLKTEDGKMLTVDMGLESSAKKVQEGDSVNVTGVPASVGDRVILIADQQQS